MFVSMLIPMLAQSPDCIAQQLCGHEHHEDATNGPWFLNVQAGLVEC